MDLKWYWDLTLRRVKTRENASMSSNGSMRENAAMSSDAPASSTAQHDLPVQNGETMSIDPEH